MDPQRRFLASTLQGALDADVVSLEDLYRHLPAEVLAEHIDPAILWECLSKAMSAAGLGSGPPSPRVSDLNETSTAGDDRPETSDVEVADVSPEQVEPATAITVDDNDIDDVPDGSRDAADDLGFDVESVIEDLPPLPVDDALIVEEVNWGDDHDGG
jgi:hypothetical protein